jgi:hypothetical protein
MDPFHFTCCHCGVRLRMRDRLFVGRQVNCPECRRSLLVSESAGKLVVGPVARATPPADAGGKPTVAAPNATASTRPDVRARCAATCAKIAAFSRQQPALALLGVVGVCALLLTIAFVARRQRSDEISDPSLTGVLPPVANSSIPESHPTHPEPPAESTATDSGGRLAVAPAGAETSESGEPRLANVKPVPDARAEPIGIGKQVPPAGNRPDFFDVPILPVLAPSAPNVPVAETAAPVIIDVLAALEQPIDSFEQSRTVPLRGVLTQVAEMAGAVVAFDADELGPAADKLAQPVTLKLQKTTVREILERLLEPAGLTFKIHEQTIRLRPVSPGTAAP